LVQDSEIVADLPVASVARGVGHDHHVDPRCIPLGPARRLGGHGHRVAAPFAVNALFHLAAWIALGDYAPGAVTGVVVSIPATGHFFAWVRRQAVPPRPNSILAVAVGTVVAAVAIGFLFLPDRGAGFRPDSAQPRGTSPTRQSHRTPGPCPAP